MKQVGKKSRSSNFVHVFWLVLHSRSPIIFTYFFRIEVYNAWSFRVLDSLAQQLDVWDPQAVHIDGFFMQQNLWKLTSSVHKNDWELGTVLMTHSQTIDNVILYYLYTPLQRSALRSQQKTIIKRKCAWM